MNDGNKYFMKNCMVDDSDNQHFRFALRCGICAKRWEAEPVPISTIAAAEGYVGKTYQDERIWALDEAACHAADYFERCPICGKLACRNCIITHQNLTMCRSCLSLLEDRKAKRNGSD